MLNLFKNFKIRVKLMLILAICLIVVILGSVYILEKEKKYRLERTLEKGANITQFLSHVSSMFMQNFDYATISDFIKNVKNDTDFCYVIIHNAAGGIIPISEGDKKIKDSLTKDYFLNNIRIFKAPIVYFGLQVGDIEIGISLERINREFYNSITRMIFFFVVLAVFITTMIMLISRLITRPVANLMEGIKRISQGELDYQIKVYSNDEIGILTGAFNSMSKRLLYSRDELQEYSQTLESKVKQRTREIQEANDELKEINKELADFTHIVSHDLKEPLRAIDAFSKFVYEDLKEKTSVENKDYLERIRINVFRMQDLIENLLAISQAAKMRNPFEEINTETVLEEIKERFSYAIAQKNAEVTFKKPFLPVYCDRLKIGEVFANLIDNALKFSDKPKPKIEIGCREEDEFYCFYVKDNGIGIEKRHFDKIFQIFQRLHTQDEYPGTGVGLAICKKIIEQHYGKIWVESEAGEGSVFYFTLLKKPFYAKRVKAEAE